MKGIFFSIVYIISCNIGFSQDNSGQEVLTRKEQRQQTKEQRKAEKLEMESQFREITEGLLQNQRFILEADYLAGRNGSRFPVSSTLNFILVDSSNAVLQIGSPHLIGYNGVGGITIDARITKFVVGEKETKKGKSYNVTMYLISSLGPYDIQFWISPTGNADATVRGNYSGSLTYTGRLVPLQKSRIYKGMSSP